MLGLVLEIFLGSIEFVLGILLCLIEVMLTPMKYAGKKVANPGPMTVR
jgi:hypothetical protein